ncbi:unnamed protein product [Closterium sp. Yama58-4]|nr:unnamed protein product [Closterium sp. Yama58-4]
MECNREDAAKAKELAEAALSSGDYARARRLVTKAQSLFPNLDGLTQVCAVVEVHEASLNRVGGDVDWYALLQIPAFCDDDSQIKKAYRRLALLLHPDKNKTSGAEAAFKLLSEAFTVVSDKQKKAVHDAKRRMNATTGRAGAAAGAKASRSQQKAPAAAKPPPAAPAAGGAGGQGAGNQFETRCPTCGTRFLCLKDAMATVVQCIICKSSFKAVPVTASASNASAAGNAAGSVEEALRARAEEERVQRDRVAGEVQQEQAKAQVRRQMQMDELLERRRQQQAKFAAAVAAGAGASGAGNGAAGAQAAAGVGESERGGGKQAGRRNRLRKRKQGGKGGGDSSDDDEEYDFRMDADSDDVDAARGAGGGGGNRDPLQGGYEGWQAGMGQAHGEGGGMGEDVEMVGGGTRRSARSRKPVVYHLDDDDDDDVMEVTAAEAGMKGVNGTGAGGGGQPRRPRDDQNAFVGADASKGSGPDATHGMARNVSGRVQGEGNSMDVPMDDNPGVSSHAAGKEEGRSGERRGEGRGSSSGGKKSGDGKRNGFMHEGEVVELFSSDEEEEKSEEEGNEEEEEEVVRFSVPDPDFHCFDDDRTEETFRTGDVESTPHRLFCSRLFSPLPQQVWTLYDDSDGFPRFLCTIRQVSHAPFSCTIVWLEAAALSKKRTAAAATITPTEAAAALADPAERAEPSIGYFKFGKPTTFDSVNIFSFRISKLASPNARTATVLPEIGQVWALYAEKSFARRRYYLVEVIPAESSIPLPSDPTAASAAAAGVQGLTTLGWRAVWFLERVPGEVFSSLFQRIPGGTRFVRLNSLSHLVPSFHLQGNESSPKRLPPPPRGALELDPAATPSNLAPFPPTVELEYDEENERNTMVENVYHINHSKQTLGFVLAMKERHLKLDKAEMSVWEAAELLNELVDDSDPDLDMAQIEHALQAAEAIRRDHPSEEEDWYPLVGFLHDMGKVLLHPKFGSEPQWAVVGDTFPVGCRFSNKIVHSKFFNSNPDSSVEDLSTECGIYEEGCGMDKVHISWGHDEYMYQVLVQNGCSIPPQGLYMIRYHSFYALHRDEEYQHLMDDFDREMLPWLKDFNQYDLYSKSAQRLDMEELKPYYQRLIARYIPKATLKW